MEERVMEQMVLAFDRAGRAEAEAPPAAFPAAASGQRRAARRGRRRVDTISEPQRRTLAKIVELTECAGYPPTICELAVALGISMPSAYQQMRLLVRKGYISREPRKARSITIERSPEGSATAKAAGTSLTPSV